MEYGLIGEHLPHSFSKIIHEKLAPYSYELHELRPDEVDSFMRGKEFKGINVTIPYKQTVIPYLDEISDQARSIGAVNTVVNRNGRLCGYNTDYFGMKSLIERLGIDPAGKKVLILGTGGTSKTAFAVATDMGASEVYKVSRTGKEGVPTYEEAYERHTDAQIIINTTPCGMYPAIDDCPLDLSRFPDLCGVIDAIYNPLRTVLILEAQKRGIPAEGGLYMLVVQAVYAAELFADRKIESEKTDQVFKEILNSKRNIVLSGMSLAGKTTLGTLLAKKLDRVLEDTDQMIIRKEQRPITEIFATDGEKYFRDLETEMARTLAPQTGLVIATGGGAILRQENVDALKKNGCIIFLDRPFNQILPADDRPLANTKEKVAALLEKRYPIYKATCDESITNDLTPEEGIAKILAALQNV
ncbi:MAG: shikimate dehydrogenase [Lachnospiraceae bacterium]|jgi:shikimate dehydrogenase|nr:shikimate dehydrogenase [Lachnospiraceae bacterium]